jgi:hypothetical protein
MATKRRQTADAKPAVHPVADLFPMLADDELAELAEDIKQRGLLHPIVLDGEGRILDGRNRQAACELAGVEPSTVVYDGDDPDGYALAVNIARRHMTKGQLAMLIVDAKPELFRDETVSANTLMIGKATISKARLVKQYASALVAPVISGADQLERAYKFAQDEKAKSEGTDAQLARLRAEDPELAAKVVEGELTLTGAWAERKERVALERRDKEAARRAAGTLLSDFQSAVATVVIGARLGEPDLITKDTIGEIRAAVALLEELL